jgi:hypothetical protein
MMVSDPDVVTTFLSALRDTRLSILIGLAITGYAVLFAPAFGGVNPQPFRQAWGVWIWIEAMGFSVLSLARILDAGISAYRDHAKAIDARRILRFVPLHQQCWWHLAKQQDESVVSQIRIDIQAANTSERPVQIVKVRLIKPRAELLHADALLPMKGSPYHSYNHPVPRYGTETVAVHLMLRGELSAQGKPIRITLGITDQYGEEYRLRNLLVRTMDTPRRRPPLLEQLRHLKLLGAKFFRSQSDSSGPQSPVMPWTYDQGPEYIGICESILNEEKRNYAAHGRSCGGLGSLSVGLQSEPNNGWTKAGEVPQLLWENDKRTPITSPNLERLLRTRDALDAPDSDNLERYLLAQLCQGSPFAEVAYFVFIALHRMGRTIEALKTAGTFLAGDKVYAYSNLLGALSALVSHEHFAIDPNLYPLLLDAVAPEEADAFKLREKINLARLEFLDRGAHPV